MLIISTILLSLKICTLSILRNRGDSVIDENNYELVPAEDDNFPLRIRRYSGAAAFRMHWHGHLELLYFIKGGAMIFCGEEEYAVEDGNMIIANANELHRGDFAATDVDYLCIMLPPSFFDLAGGNRRYIFKNCIKSDTNIRRLSISLFETAESTAEGWQYRAMSIAYELAAYLARNYAKEQLNRDGYAQRSSKLESFNNVIEYITKHCAEPITTADAAKMAHLSESYFCHMFKKHTGNSFTAYLNGIRVQKAAVLLNDTRMTVTETAAAVGFNDVNYFCRVFKSRTGVSPRRYKKENMY